MRQKILKYSLVKVASFLLFVASVSITQCSVGAAYQIPVDKNLKEQILSCSKK